MAATGTRAPCAQPRPSSGAAPSPRWAPRTGRWRRPCTARRAAKPSRRCANDAPARQHDLGPKSVQSTSRLAAEQRGPPLLGVGTRGSRPLRPWRTASTNLQRQPSRNSTCPRWQPPETRTYPRSTIAHSIPAGIKAQNNSTRARNISTVARNRTEVALPERSGLRGGELRVAVLPGLVGRGLLFVGPITILVSE